MYDNTQSAGGSPADSRDECLPSALSDRQLLVVSNRQPYRHDYADEGDRLTVDRPTGGLTAGLDPVMQRVGGTWIAWGDGEADRDVVGPDDCTPVPPSGPEYTLRRVWLSDEQVRGYYYGYSNQVLWPLSHSTLTNVHCQESFWEHYRRANEQFADAVVEQAEDRPLVWFQDYHLALAPRLARPRLPEDAVFMQFWHIPWPSWDVFRACPHARALLEGLLGNDVLGFHVQRYGNNFLSCVDAAFDDATVDWQAGSVTYRGQVTQVEDAPMGVPADDIRRQATTPTGTSFPSALEAKHDIDAGTRLVVGVDRLDYTKGIPERLQALEQLWETRPEWRGEFTFVQKASESRSRIPAYREIQEEVDAAVERINERFGTDDWQPIVYTTDQLDQEELYGLYRHADAALVTPIRDGMNLVAQEYVAAQVDGDGVLVLSDQTGAHDVLGDHALSTNPYDVEQIASRVAEALTMPAEERRVRMEQLRRYVTTHDLSAWMDRCFDAAGAAAAGGQSRQLQRDAT